MSNQPQVPASSTPLSEQELASLRQNLTLLRSQVQAGRVDESFLGRQVESLLDVMGRLGEERKQRRKEGRFQAINEVSRAIGSSLDLQTVLDQVMDAIIKLTGAERGFLMLRDDDGGLAVKAARNLDQQTLGSEQFQFSRTVANQVLDAGNPVLTNNAVEDPRFAGQKSIVSQALRSIMATPLRARGAVIGVVYVDNRMMSGLFTEDDLAALDTFAGQAAVAIDNARLFSATDQALAARVEELQTLRRIDLQLNETLDADKAMQIGLDWALRLSGARIGYLGLVTEGRVKQVRQSGEAAAEAPVYLDDTYPDVLKVVESGAALLTTTDALSRLIVPIKREAQVIGVVLVERTDGIAFTPEQQDLVERVVARAAVTIENARLYAAVRAADLAKSEFVGIVAHDLKVPMTSIMGYSDLAMRMGDVNERQREFLQKVKDTVKRMAVLVSDLADISRIEGGHFYMDERRITVADIVRAVEDASITQVQEYEHEYAQDIEADLPDMQVDYYRLLQVLTNFVSNAFKYTPNGGKVTFRVRRTPDQRIEFSVQDTGIGLTPEQVAKLGTKFWRAEDEFTRSRPGTGLGFAITRSLVEQMGSRVQIESTPGQGSTFRFSVRMAE
jgi:K+-sensing histidine kinase KdpD